MDIKAVKRTLVVVAGSVAASCFSSAASAQSFSKAEAILGGPSALERLIAAQNGTATPRPLLQPASYSYQRPAVVPAVARDVPAAVPAVFRDRPLVSPGVASGRPDIFGTVALRVGHTALDARWHRIEHSTVGGSAAKFAAPQRGKDAVERLEAVNWYVNRQVHF